MDLRRIDGHYIHLSLKIVARFRVRDCESMMVLASSFYNIGIYASSLSAWKR